MRVKNINRNLIETFFLKGSKDNKRPGAGKPHYKTSRKEQSGQRWGPGWDQEGKLGMQEPFS